MRKTKPSNASFLFDRQNPELIPRDTHVIEAQEVRRLSRQNAAVLARLQRGPVSNHELMDRAYGLNPRARISDLRAAGYKIPAPVEDKTTGLAWYRLDETNTP